MCVSHADLRGADRELLELQTLVHLMSDEGARLVHQNEQAKLEFSRKRLQFDIPPEVAV